MNTHTRFKDMTYRCLIRRLYIQAEEDLSRKLNPRDAIDILALLAGAYRKTGLIERMRAAGWLTFRIRFLTRVLLNATKVEGKA